MIDLEGAWEKRKLNFLNSTGRPLDSVVADIFIAEQQIIQEARLQREMVAMRTVMMGDYIKRPDWLESHTMICKKLDLLGIDEGVADEILKALNITKGDK